MFGGLTRTSSRIAIAVALGFAFGGIGLGSNTAKAADLGGDCCADLEERVAELEATTVRKGNKKVSVTLSGWVVKSVNWWDDGDLDHFVVGDKDADLASRFAITGSAQIAPGWSAGFNMTVVAPATTFGITANQFDDTQGLNGDINTLYSYIYIKSDTFGTLNWGHLSPASDNPAVLADISGTVIESNFVFFDGGGFFLRPDGGPGGAAGLIPFVWSDFLNCRGLGAGIGVDCWGAPFPAIRYDSPTWGGFRFEASYGNTGGVAALPGVAGALTAQDVDFADIAVFYANDWGNWKVSAAYAFTWVETAATPLALGELTDSELHQVGGSIMHTPTGLGIYAMGQWEEAGSILPDTDAWGVKPFWKTSLTPLGATVFYGEYAQYNDQISAAAFLGGAIGSEVERYGAGVVQEIDAAAMHLFARWQHQELDIDVAGIPAFTGFEDLDIFQAGGVIFF